MSGCIASMFRAVSTSVSPFVTEDVEELQLTASAERILAAVSKEVRVRVEASKNRFTTALPRKVGTFFSGRRSTSFMEVESSRTVRSSSRDRCSSPMRCR